MPIKRPYDVPSFLSHYVEVLLHQVKALLQSAEACLSLTLFLSHTLYLGWLESLQLCQFSCYGRADALQGAAVLLQLLQ
jgi:hypothetical protein